MKSLLRIALLLLCTNVAFAQISKSDIVGIWQAGSKELTAGWNDNYQFFADGRFCFNISQYDGTSRVKSLCGTYKIKHDTLMLTITQSKEIQGGVFVRSETAGGSGWVIEGGKVVTIPFKSLKKNYLQIEKANAEDGIPCILIDKGKHYRLESDPNSYN